MLQIVNRRFNRRMLTAYDDKHPVLLAFPVDLRQALLSRQHVVIQKLVETKPVFGAAEAAVEAAPAKVGEARLGLPDHRLGIVHVAALPHDLVVQDEASEVLQHADRNPEIHRVWLSKIENTFSSCGRLWASPAWWKKSASFNAGTAGSMMSKMHPRDMYPNQDILTR